MTSGVALVRPKQTFQSIWKVARERGANGFDVSDISNTCTSPAPASAAVRLRRSRPCLLAPVCQSSLGNNLTYHLRLLILIGEGGTYDEITVIGNHTSRGGTQST